MRREDADSAQFEATYIVLAEVAEILQEFDGTALAGGTVPFLLIPQGREPHEGTVDIDVVVAPDRLRSDSERTLHDILLICGFDQDTKKPFRYTKTVSVRGEGREVLLELLAGGTPPPDGLRRIEAEDVYVSVIEGLEIALDHPVAKRIPGRGTIQVTSMAGFLAMKSFALERREQSKKPKDAYDIVYCLRNYPGGVDAIAAEINVRLPNVLLEAGILRLTSQFASQDSLGPTAYSRRALTDEEERFMRREAFEYVNDLLDRLP